MLNQILEIYKNFPPEEKLVFQDLLEDIINWDTSNNKKQTIWIQQIKSKQYATRIANTFVDHLKEKKISEKEFLDDFKQTQLEYLCNWFWRKKDDFLWYTISKIWISKQKWFLDELRKLKKELELDNSIITDLRKELFTHILVEYWIIEVWSKKNFSKAFIKKIEKEDQEIGKFLENMPQEFRKFIEKIIKDTEEFYWEDFLDNAKEKIDEVDKNIQILIYKKEELKELTVMIKNIDIKLFFDKETWILYSSWSREYKFEKNLPPYNFMCLMFPNWKVKNKKQSHSNIYFCIEKNHSWWTLRTDEDKAVRNLISHINKIIKTKTLWKIIKAFWPAKDWTIRAIESYIKSSE